MSQQTYTDGGVGTSFLNLRLSCPTWPGPGSYQSSDAFPGYAYVMLRTGGPPWPTNNITPMQIDRIPQPSNKWLLTDCSAVTGLTPYAFNKDSVSEAGAPVDGSIYQYSPWSRHNGGANYFYFDGHVEWIKAFPAGNTTYTDMADPYK